MAVELASADRLVPAAVPPVLDAATSADQTAKSGKAQTVELIDASGNDLEGAERLDGC
jgi:hypothetical protein